MEKNRNFVFGHRTLCLKLFLFFHDPEIEHFGDPDSIASNEAFFSFISALKYIIIIPSKP